MAKIKQSMEHRAFTWWLNATTAGKFDKGVRTTDAIINIIAEGILANGLTFHLKCL